METDRHGPMRTFFHDTIEGGCAGGPVHICDHVPNVPLMTICGVPIPKNWTYHKLDDPPPLDIICTMCLALDVIRFEENPLLRELAAEYMVTGSAPDGNR